MSKFIIKGGKILQGEWRVQGMKNAATPILAATLLTDKECVLSNVPRISDVEKMVEIMRTLGAKAEWLKDNHTLKIRTPQIKPNELDKNKVKAMRSSVLFLGPLLARLGRATMPEPGGCIIGNRPLDTHFAALGGLGAKLENQGEYFTIFSDNLQGSVITLPEKSVTATENLMMAASLARGTTIIKNPAQEPHIVALGAFLRALGANLEGEGTAEIKITGVSELSGTSFAVIPDQLEVGTIAVLGALIGKEIKIAPVADKDMDPIAEKLAQAGVDFERNEDFWIVRNSRLRLRAFNLTTAPHPGFPTDLGAQFGVLATQAEGESVINDPMFNNRLGYIEELKKMGAAAEKLDNHTARITGPAPLFGTEIKSLDIRAGAAVLIAALAAAGESVIHNIELIERGYERIDERLRALGAEIERVEEKVKV